MATLCGPSVKLAARAETCFGLSSAIRACLDTLILDSRACMDGVLPNRFGSGSGAEFGDGFCSQRRCHARIRPKQE